MEKEYEIDYDMFEVNEMVQIITFMQLIEKTKTNKVDKGLLITKYNEYRLILNNKALEKKYDKMLYAKSKVSIFQVMKVLK